MNMKQEWKLRGKSEKLHSRLIDSNLKRELKSIVKSKS